MPKKDGEVLRPVKKGRARRWRITSGPRGLGIVHSPTHFRIESDSKVINLYLNVRDYVPIEGRPGHFVIIASRLAKGYPGTVAWGTYCRETQKGEVWIREIEDCYMLYGRSSVMV